MEEFIVIDTKTNRVVLQPTTCHNAYVYANFLNNGEGNRYRAVNMHMVNYKERKDLKS